MLSSRCLSQKAELPVVTTVIVEERIEIWPVGYLRGHKALVLAAKP